jgi:hypothetical protein
MIAVGLCFLFVLNNGTAPGIADFDPISSAFVMSAFILAAPGLRDPGIGLWCASGLWTLDFGPWATLHHRAPRRAKTVTTRLPREITPTAGQR